jgi:glycosyltransferase involved in cell wall biosynthesis
MAAAPRVSIGLPVYNGERHVGAAIADLVAQDFRDFELVISDNASTDATERICRDWAARDSRIRYVRQPENIGVKRNFRFVLDEARADYFLWAAHDDRWAPGYLSAMVNALDASSDALLATPRTEVAIHRGDRVKHAVHGPSAGTGLAAYRQLLRERSAVWIYGMYRTAMLRTCFMEYVERDYPVWGGDVVWLASLLLRYPVVGTNDAVFYKQEYESRFRPKGEADQWQTWSLLFRWLTRVARDCAPTTAVALPAVWEAWRFCFRGYLSRGNPVGTAVRCAKVAALGAWFSASALFAKRAKEAP